jgi:hypothetical protein
LFKYKLQINLSVGSKIAVVAKPFDFTSTGVVLFPDHPIGVGSDVNNKVVIPPVVYLDIVK